MKYLLKKLLSGAVFGLGLSLAISLAGAGLTNNPIASFTGPGGTNPTVDFPPGIGTLNTLINSMNNEVFFWLTLGNASEQGEIGLTSGNAFAAGYISKTPSLGTLTPSNQTVPKEWMVVIDEAGYAGYIPVF